MDREEKYSEIKNALTGRQSKAAARISLEILALDPNDKTASELLEHAIKMEAGIERAADQFDRGLPISSDALPFWIYTLQAWADGNIPLAMLRARRLIRNGCRDPHPFHLLAASYLRLGRFDLAERTLGQYLATSTPAISRLERYLAIRPWAVGFWGEVHHVIVHCLLADILKRTPIVVWTADIRFGTPDTNNAWDLYFEPVAGVTMDVLADLDDWEPNRWNYASLLYRRVNHIGGPRAGRSSIELIGKESQVAVADGYSDLAPILDLLPSDHPLFGATPNTVYRTLFDRHLRLKPFLKRRVTEISEGWLRPMIAVHHRSPIDVKLHESLEGAHVNIERYFQEIDRMLEMIQGANIFLMTDSTELASEYRARYGNLLAFQTQAARISDPAEIEVTFDLQLEGTRIAEEVILDVYLATRCQAFIGDGASAVSAAVLHLRDWPNDRLILTRENVFQLL